MGNLPAESEQLRSVSVERSDETMLSYTHGRVAARAAINIDQMLIAATDRVCKLNGPDDERVPFSVFV